MKNGCPRGTQEVEFKTIHCLCSPNGALVKVIVMFRLGLWSALLVTHLHYAAWAADHTVAARVNGAVISSAEVERELKLAKTSTPADVAAQKQLWQAALAQVIDRRLVLGYLTKIGEAASAADVNLALAQFEQELKAQNLSLDQHCQQVGFTKEELRQALGWKVSWKRYCDKQLTPANLQKYFERQRRDFDGTQLRISQILFKMSGTADEAAVPALEDRASNLRSEIVSGKITFEAAARQQSQAPSRETGGDIGWIERHRPMPEEFSRVAYTLKKGEVSQPLISPFGVHLITVLDEKPGSLQPTDVQSELRQAVTLYLFRWIADKERAAATIEFPQADQP